MSKARILSFCLDKSKYKCSNVRNNSYCHDVLTGMCNPPVRQSFLYQVFTSSSMTPTITFQPCSQLFGVGKQSTIENNFKKNSLADQQNENNMYTN